MTTQHSIYLDPIVQPLEKKHILIVDDELMILYTMKRMLANSYDITTANSGSKAIDLINEKDSHFDMVICDVSMPNINGVNLYLYITKNKPELENKIVFMTGGPYSTYLDDFLVSNKKICLSKPFDPTQLHQAIENTLLHN